MGQGGIGHGPSATFGMPPKSTQFRADLNRNREFKELVLPHSESRAGESRAAETAPSLKYQFAFLLWGVREECTSAGIKLTVAIVYV